jgi:hypothetical protein
MRPITLILPYYENPTMFVEQQTAWSKYPDELRRNLHVIVVDDGSPKSPALPHVRDSGVASFRLFRVGVDVRWNWIFCRNLGVSKATTEWVFLTDMDHVMPRKTLAFMQTAELDARKAYRMSRVDAPNLTPYKPHPNTWFLTTDLFDKIGGYDERFSGFYGTDGEFRNRVQRTADEIVILKSCMIRYPREVIADASTTRYGRKEPQDRENVRRIVTERAEIPNWRPLRLTFPYEQQV